MESTGDGLDERLSHRIIEQRNPQGDDGAFCDGDGRDGNFEILHDGNSWTCHTKEQSPPIIASPFTISWFEIIRRLGQSIVKSGRLNSGRLKNKDEVATIMLSMVQDSVLLYHYNKFQNVCVCVFNNLVRLAWVTLHLWAGLYQWQCQHRSGTLEHHQG